SSVAAEQRAGFPSHAATSCRGAQPGSRPECLSVLRDASPRRPARPRAHDVSTFTSLVRPEAPDLITTAPLRHLKCSAIKATSSSLAYRQPGGLSTALAMSRLPAGSAKTYASWLLPLF